MKPKIYWSYGALIIGTICSFTMFFPDTWKAQISNTTVNTACTPPRILYFNAQPNLYGRDGEVQEFQDIKALVGTGVVLENHLSVKTITKDVLSSYNILWIHGGCGGESYPFKSGEVAVIKDFYLKGGSLILSGGDDYAGGDLGPAGADCQTRINDISENLGITFSGRVRYENSANSCRTIRGSGSVLLNNIEKIYRESSGKMTIGSVAWGKTKPEFIGEIPENKEPALAIIPPDENHGGAVFSPQDQGFSAQCSGKDGLLYKRIFDFLGHAVTCKDPVSVPITTEIAGGSCTFVQRSLYGSGAVKVACPKGTVIMGGGWNNGGGETFDQSMPFEEGGGWQCTGNRDDALGTCTAICCDANLYDSTIVYREGGLSDHLTPTCSPDRQLLGGGFIDGTTGKDEDIFAPQDESNGWTCYDDDSKQQSGSRCFALCGKRKTSDIMVCKTTSVIGAQDPESIAYCPPGTFVTGGGFEDKSTSNHDQDKSMPLPTADGWACSKTGNLKKSGTGANICYARCCTLPEDVLSAGPVIPLVVQSASSAGVTASSLPSVLSSQQSLSSTSSSLSPFMLPPPQLPSSATSIPSSAPALLGSSSSEQQMAATESSTSSVQEVGVSGESLSSSISSTDSSTSASIESSTASSAASFIRSSASIAVASSVSNIARAESSSSAAIAQQCPVDACAIGGQAYCTGYGLRCAQIADAPCFVCLSAGTTASVTAVSSMRALPTVSVESPTSAGSSRTASSAMVSPLRPLTAELQPMQQQPHPAASHAPVGATGPGTLGIMAAGAASGMAWIRRKHRRG